MHPILRQTIPLMFKRKKSSNVDGTIGGGVNKDGIDYYNNLINLLVENGTFMILMVLILACSSPIRFHNKNKLKFDSLSYLDI